MGTALIPWQSILEFESVAGMGDGVDVWVETCHKLAGARWNHCNAWGQQPLISECPDQCQHSIRRPRSDKQKADCDASFRNSNFNRGFRYIHIRSQAFNVHLLSLSFQGFLMIHDMRHNLTVVINNHWHRDHVGEGENCSHKHSVVEGVR